jgi:hypothetical protein
LISGQHRRVLSILYSDQVVVFDTDNRLLRPCRLTGEGGDAGGAGAAYRLSIDLAQYAAAWLAVAAISFQGGERGFNGIKNCLQIRYVR